MKYADLWLGDLRDEFKIQKIETQPLGDKFPGHPHFCHTAPNFISAFSGLKQEEHQIFNFGVRGYKEQIEELKKRKVFIWQKFNSIAYDILIDLPPLSYGVDYSPETFGLPVNEEEMLYEFDEWRETFKRAISLNPDLLVTVLKTLDLVYHLKNKYDREFFEYWHRKVNEFLTELLNSYKGKLIIFSDHNSEHKSPGILLTRGIEVKQEIKKIHEVYNLIYEVMINETENK
jgi:hypothetical protein